MKPRPDIIHGANGKPVDSNGKPWDVVVGGETTCRRLMFEKWVERRSGEIDRYGRQTRLPEDLPRIERERENRQGREFDDYCGPTGV